MTDSSVYLIDAFDRRIAADYGVKAEISAEDARVLVKQAKEFVSAAGTFLVHPNTGRAALGQAPDRTSDLCPASLSSSHLVPLSAFACARTSAPAP